MWKFPKRLAMSFGSELVLEDAASNPFLERFYKNSSQAAFPTQLFFLFQRAQQLQDMRQSDLFNPVIVSDFLMEKDRLFVSNENPRIQFQHPVTRANSIPRTVQIFEFDGGLA